MEGCLACVLLEVRGVEVELAWTRADGLGPEVDLETIELGIDQKVLGCPRIRLERDYGSSRRCRDAPESDICTDIHEYASDLRENALTQFLLVQAEEHEPLGVLSEVEPPTQPLAFDVDLGDALAGFPEHAVRQAPGYASRRRAQRSCDGTAPPDTECVSEPRVHSLGP